MKKKIIIITAFIFGLWSGIFWQSQPVKAMLSDVSVTPIVENSNVTDKFQIVAQPNRVYRVKMSLTNFGNSDIRLRIRPTNASTSSNGRLIYSEKVQAGQNDLRYAFADLTAPQNLNLKSNQTKQVSFQIKLPPEKFRGLMIGGFYIYDLNSPHDPGLKVPVWLTETNKAIGGVLSLSGIEPQAVAQSPFINVNLSNNQPGLMKNVTVHMNLRRKGLLEFFKLGFKPMIVDQRYAVIAPNSKVPIAFDQQRLPIKPGIYQAQGTARSNKTKWKFAGNFRITQAQADRVNHASRNLTPDRTVMYLGIVLGILILIIFVIWGLWSQQRQMKQGR